MAKFEDLTGRKFGRLTVIERAPNNNNGKVCWRCRCSCKDGKIVTVSTGHLKSGDTQSCGCLRIEQPSHTTHGKTGTPIYKTWKHINRRCNDPKHPDYKHYGGRGIRVCERWRKFENFYEDVSKLEHFGEKGYSLDRIDNDGNYEPNNVRWADRKTQARNRRSNVFVEYQGERMTLADAAEKSGINYGLLSNRYRRGDRGERLFRPAETKFRSAKKGR